MEIMLKIQPISITRFRFKYLGYTAILFFLVNQLAMGQQQPLYSQFDNNKYLFNPAVAGSEAVTTIHVNAYEQWIGFKGAPKFHTASIDSKIFNQDRRPTRNVRKKFKIKKPENVGLGMQLFTEKYGPLSHSGMVGTYSYHLRMRDKQLSFGFSSVLSNYGLKASEVVLSDDLPDQMVEGDNTRRWIVDFDFGMYFSGINYFAGYSIHHISESGLQWGGSVDADYQLGRLHYLMAGYSYEVTPDFSVQPSTLIKLSEKNRSQLDINIKCIISKKYWAGLSYKTSKTTSIFAGLQYDRYIFCYSFDYSLAAIRKYSYGSHEIHLAMRLGNETSRYKWLNKY
jgi:type IX secretion system PorP/SprF family membrane protein